MHAGRRATFRSNDPRAAWTFDAGPAEVVLTFDEGRGARAIDADGRVRFASDDPFAALAWMAAERIEAGQRWVGFIGYAFARCVERLAAKARDDLHLPTFEFALCLEGEAPAEPGASGRPAVRREPQPPACVVGRSLSRAAYLDAARRSLDYIAAGDVFQLNLAQRFTVATPRSPVDVWHALCRDAPAAYGALIETGDAAIVCNSPELFFRIDADRRIVSRPIKGTRPVGVGMRDELARSAKDAAELAMIVDLQRNDLGRVCALGSVVVTEPRAIETTATVHHGVATIEGTLRRDVNFADVVRALFPCGSITGCPKVRAMELIDELEPVARGPYCGAIGHVAADGSAEFNVAIRTAVIRGGLAQVYVGGGIVADSAPEAEHEETLVKARAMLAALGVDDAAIATLRDA